MNEISSPGLPRRKFLQTALGLVVGGACAKFAWADGLSKDTPPQTISGGMAEPDWEPRATITVGPKQADHIGSTDRVLQSAVDSVAHQGGGTVRVLPGVYRLRNSIFLQSNVRLLGSGADSVLFKEPSVTSKITLEGDHRDQEITVADPSGFQVGDGVRIIRRDPYDKVTTIMQRTLVATSGNRFKLDLPLEARFHREEGDPLIATNFALLQGNRVADAAFENLTLDANKANNEMVDQGRYDDGSLRLDKCNRIAVRKVTVRNSYCDSIVWLSSDDVLVEDCHCYDGARLALHPGQGPDSDAGSQRSVVRGNRVERCETGVYFCWGAQHGLYEKNVIEDCEYGMSFGDADSDNLIRDNDIRRSGKVGIRFFWKEKSIAPHRNRFERNRIIDSGGKNGIAIDITGETESVTVIKNELKETREPLSRIGIRIGAETRDTRCEDNKIEGFAIPIKDLSKGK